eukprot:394720-Pleurochrysis_carterae.AAC.1
MDGCGDCMSALPTLEAASSLSCPIEHIPAIVSTSSDRHAVTLSQHNLAQIVPIQLLKAWAGCEVVEGVEAGAHADARICRLSVAHIVELMGLLKNSTARHGFGKHAPAA